MNRIVCITFLCVSLLVFFMDYALALPSGPPPAGKIWVEVGGEWILVIAPPGDGPYIWKNGIWVIDQTPPPAESEWVPGHWSSKGWVPGHWKLVPSPGAGVKWVQGHWSGNKWVPGHWTGSPPYKKHWVPAHRGPRGYWVPGHWR